MTDPKNPCDPQSKKISQAPPPMTYLTVGSAPPAPPGRPQRTPKGMVWILDFIEQNEDAWEQLDGGDATAFKRSRDGRLRDIKKHEWGDDQFWTRVCRTGHVRDTVASTAPAFVKKGGAGSADEPPVAAPKDWHEQVIAWFVEEYVPAHVDDNPCPTRDDSYTAARKKFPGWPIKRDDTWRSKIWADHAPTEWKKRGPR